MAATAAFAGETGRSVAAAIRLALARAASGAVGPNPASMTDAIDAFNGAAGADLPRLYVLGSMEELGAESATYHRQLGRLLHLRRGDFLFALGSQAAALREGLLENGNDPAQVAVVADVAPVRERLAGFKGAVFLKGSRRYQLETVLDPHAHAHAH